MKRIKFFAVIIGLLALANLAPAQNMGQPRGDRAERTAALVEKMATDLGLNADQKASLLKLQNERIQSFMEKMRTAVSDEERKEMRQAAAREFNKKLDDTFGNELADKMRTWLKENAPKRPQQQQPEPGSRP